MTRRATRSSSTVENWRHWWRFNRDEFLNLKAALFDPRNEVESGSPDFFFGERTSRDAVNVRRPSPTFVRDRIAPRLADMLRSKHASMRYHAAIALGKTGEPSHITRLAGLLGDETDSVREGAVIALAILGSPAARPIFMSLLEDDRTAKVYLHGQQNTSNVRGAAALGLGLLAEHPSGDVIEVLERHALDRKHTHHIPQMAAIALGLLKGDEQVVARVAAALCRIADDRRGHGWARGQALVAIGRLYARNRIAMRSQHRELILDYLVRGKSTLMRRSAALATGYLAGDAALVKKLRTTMDRAKDGVTRNFAAISLGRAGGPGAEKALEDGMLNGRVQSRAYCALGLAIRLRDVKTPQAKTHALKRLRFAFAKTKDPMTRGAVAIAIGIARDRESSLALLEALESTGDVNLRGDCAMALGMIRHRRALPQLVEALDDARHDAALRERIAVSIGLLGSKEAVGPLLLALREGKTVSALNSTTTALGLVGDRSAVEPVLELLKDHRVITRASACAALGTIGDPRPLPALSAVRASHNYFSSCRDLNHKLLEIDR